MPARDKIIWKQLTFELNSINVKQNRGLPSVIVLLHAITLQLYRSKAIEQNDDKNRYYNINFVKYLEQNSF